MLNPALLLDLDNHLRALSRAAVFFHHASTESDGDDAPGLWSLGTEINLFHAGDTEGPFQIQFATDRSELKVPELTGELVHESYISGQTPSITGNVWMADPVVRRKWAPLGLNHGGHARRLRDPGITMWIVPEELLIGSDGQTIVGLDYDVDDGWVQVTLDANGDPTATTTPVPADKEHLLDTMVWLWRVKIDRAPITLQHDDGSRSLESVSVTGMWFRDTDMPNGHHVFTIGRPEAYGIDLSPAES